MQAGVKILTTEAQRRRECICFVSLLLCVKIFLIDCGAIGLTQRPGETKKCKGIAKQG
jgi:hypothetical protein